LRDDNIAPNHLAELAAALGTLEVSSGADRRGRQLLRRSLADPTENAWAQAEWFSDRVGPLAHNVPDSVQRPFEALARRFAHDAKWRDATLYARCWLQDQPFSLEAAGFASTCACEAEDWEAVSSIIDAGLKAHPNSAGLLNNLAYSRIESADLEAAAELLLRARQVPAPDETRAVLIATEGLLLYRAGKPDVGRARYRLALEAFSRLKLEENQARAALMLAREELILRLPSAEGTWREADAFAMRARTSAVRHLHERILVLRKQLDQGLRRSYPTGKLAVETANTLLKDSDPFLLSRS
jgi:tetratricopeptide (TPR) repeat protein